MTPGERIDDYIAERRNGITSVRKLARRLAELRPEKEAESWRRQIYQWKDGASPEPGQAQALAEAFDTDAADFNGRETAADVSLRQELGALRTDLQSLEDQVRELARSLRAHLESHSAEGRSRRGGAET